jgi:Spy/CpxP family protein refolding chaperone
MYGLRSAWGLDSAEKSLKARRALTAGLFFLLAATVSAAAQGHPPGGGGMGGMGMGHGAPMPGGEIRIPVGPRAGAEGVGGGGLRLGPPLRWWDDKNMAKAVGLDAKQTRRMDDVFTANREMLTRCYKTLQHEQSQLEKLTRNRDADENAIFQQIDRVTAARGELEKANAHVLLLIRKEMTPDQMQKLDEMQASAQ